MNQFFKDIKNNLPDILKKTVIRMVFGAAAVFLLNKLIHQTFGNLCFFVFVIAAYQTWREFLAQRGVGVRFVKPGDYTNSLITDRNIRDNCGNNAQSVIASSDWNAMIAYLLTAFVFLFAAVLFWMA